ncbi:MAG: carboxylesterase family protein [Streptosporangiales bacterium]|nr:carboxylesterase family protein [Streptosporangiales bacterium]
MPERRSIRHRRRPIGYSFATASFLFALPLSAAALLVVVPAPALAVWYGSVLVTEFSLALTVLAVGGLLLAWFARLFGAWVLPVAAAGLCSLALLLSLVPPAWALSSAGRAEAPLSWSEYFAGLSITADRDPRTVRYARVRGQSLRLDVWRPEVPASGPRPAIIMVHGGSWTDGQRSRLPRWDAWLAEQGYVVFDIDYRLAPPPSWRNAPGDVKCAVGWVKRNAGRYGVDPSRVSLMGSSAGDIWRC